MGILILLGLFSFRHLYGEKIIDETSTVYIRKTEKGYQLFRNGKPFKIKGASGDSRFKELADFGGNTIQLYDTINLQSNLDEALKYDIAVIVNIPIPSYNYTYTMSQDESRALKHNIKTLVEKYKDHEALLMWNLGNEIYPHVLKLRDLIRFNFLKVILEKKRYINNLNELIDIIHIEDKNHPVSTTTWIISIPKIISIKVFSPGIDLLAYNIFGNTKPIVAKFNQYHYLFGVFPYFISEFGSDGCWGSESKITSWSSPIEQTSAKKMEQVRKRYKIIEEIKYGACLGSLVFYWGNKHERTYTWFSLFKDNHKSEIIKVLKELWNNTNSSESSIGLEYMLLDKQGAADNIVFSSNEIKSAELKFYGLQNDSNLIKWEIYPEAWNDKNYPSIPLENLFIKSDKNKVEFITPSKEGPYRIFAYVYDKNGYFATTNTPFTF